MKNLITLCLLVFAQLLHAQSNVKALVGGTLLDGYRGTPIQNSVILMEGQRAKAGVDCIKLIDQYQMTMEEVYTVVDEAHKQKLTVVAHSYRPEEIRRGLMAGVDCFEHPYQNPTLKRKFEQLATSGAILLIGTAKG